MQPISVSILFYLSDFFCFNNLYEDEDEEEDDARVPSPPFRTPSPAPRAAKVYVYHTRDTKEEPVETTMSTDLTLSELLSDLSILYSPVKSKWNCKSTEF
jgi:hypothetical protein